MKLSNNFKRHEFQCHCGCGFDTVDAELLKVLEIVRAHFKNRPVKINSACRCRKHNRKVGGKANSKHLYGIAADIVVKGVSPAKVYDFLDKLYSDTYGLGKYKKFTHVDVRRRKARW